MARKFSLSEKYILLALLLGSFVVSECKILDPNQDNDWYARNYKCPDGWQQRCEKCYLYVGEEKTWSIAQAYCQKQGGNLVTVQDFSINMFLTRYVQHKSATANTIWTGLNDQALEGTFNWVDGTPSLKYEFRWLPDEPHDTPPGEDCVEMFVRSHQYLWNDAPCGDDLPFVCQTDGCVNGSQRCDNGKCVSKNTLCDGVDNCGDNSDERNCTSGCGGYMYGLGGNFSSPDFPGEYGDSRDCSWVIEVPKGYRIELQFHHFDMEDGFDFIEVLDGNTLTSNSLGHYTGHTKPSMIESTSNTMRVSLKSDDSDSLTGFYAEYKAVKTDCFYVKTLKDGEEYVINTLNYPQKYPDLKSCQWKITNVDKTNILTMVIVDMDTEQDKDFIEVRDGLKKEDPIIGRYSGNKYPTVIFSTKEHLWVKFQSNINTNSRRGFRAIIRSGCRVELNVSYGVISSPGFGFRHLYPNFLNCLWKINEPNNQPISFMFHKFDTEADYDVMKIVTKTGSLLAQYSGEKTEGWKPEGYSWILNTNQSYVEISFKSDVTYELQGFNITFSVDCPNLQQILGGQITGKSHYGGKVAYECDPYHLVKNGKDRTCLYKGKWSKQTPYCEEINCGHPGNLANGGLHIALNKLSKTFILNTTVFYYCNPGFRLEGAKQRSCQKNGIWSDSQPKCVVSKCEDPGIPMNGMIEGDDFLVGSTISYSCMEGFKLVGSKNMTCNQDGKWSSNTPTCEAIFCPVPITPENGTISGVPVNATKLAYNTELTVTCSRGFEIVGKHLVKCSAPGIWQPDLPKCQDVNECVTSNPCTGIGSKCINSIGGYSCICENGFERVNRTSCKDIDECNDRNRAVKCNQKCSNLLGGYKCSCEDGFFLYNGDNSTLEKYELKYAIVNHTCFGVNCSFPKIPPYGVVINFGNRYPVVLDYRCEEGYILKGSRFVKCLKNQKWDKEFPKCIVASCPEPTKIDNGVYSINGTKFANSSDYKLQSVVTYTCNRGYTLASGNLQRECIENKTHSFWTGETPKCERKSCGGLRNPKNGRVDITGELFEDTATYTCNGGYEIIGNNKSKCKADGKWSGSSPVCAASPCPDPGVPLRGWRSGNVALGETITYGCTVAGYVLQGNQNRTCVYVKAEGNQWTGSLPKCIDIMAPNMTCPPAKHYTLPRGETKMFVEWNLPNVTDNSGFPVKISISPQVSSPTYLPFGANKIVYTAMDRMGNKASCDVIVNIKDVEKPRIKCPDNIVIDSHVSIAVTWKDIIPADNTKIKSVVYDPPSGSVFTSNKYHQVKLTVSDLSGNIDTCVFEVYVRGCGCTQRTCPDYIPYNGTQKCVIQQFPGLGHIISCNVGCQKNLSFVDKHFIGVNKKCDPKTGWIDKPLPGCAAKTKAYGCYNAELNIKYDGSIGKKIDFNALHGHMKPVLDQLAEQAQDCDLHPQKYKIINDVITAEFRIHVKGAILRKYVKQALSGCKQKIDDKIAKDKTNLLTAASSTKLNLVGVGVEISMESCCNNTEGWCCPKGSVIRSHGMTLVEADCLACSPGMYHNGTSNRCLSCPVGTYTPSAGYDQCLTCPAGTGTLAVQSSKCTDLCDPGTYSSTGRKPVCRKCDYGHYQPDTGMKKCLKCPDGTTTAERGADNLSQCRGSCPKGQISSTGLLPCSNCTLKTYQDEEGRSVCKQCPKGGLYGGKPGATGVDECPTSDPCDQNLCKNAASCIPGNYTFVCVCAPGWTGKYCEKEIDECESSPCGNHGNCMDLLNNYNCTCIQGITGRNCETNVNDCRNDTCQNFGVCLDLINDFKCFCPPGYDGKRCEIDINECNSSPCLHNSTCEDMINDFKCNCTPGYEGKRCEIDIDECRTNQCFNNATCVDLINDFGCICKPGFKGRYCSKNIDECAPKPCQNNGTCVDLINDYRCECKPGFTGANCSTEIDECKPNPCLRNSTCIDLINKFQCQCVPGFYGDRCEFEKNECESLPCKNNATCLDKVNDYQCVCPFGYTGKQCDINIDECSPDPCINGNCTDLIGDYRCNCHEGYKGRRCEVIIDNCASAPCVNNGTCVNRIADYNCSCNAGYEGKNCEVNTNDCDPDPCNGHAIKCKDLINDYMCYCKPQYRGKNCSEIIDNCNPQPCLHNSTCKNIYQKNDFSCNCTKGYKEKRCEVEIDECQTQPCQNNANCTDLIGDYRCSCPTGFTGKNCEVNIDDCKNVTCHNGGVCKDLLNNYVCACPVTHKGRHCEKKIPNEVDIKLKGGKNSFIQHSNVSTVEEFSLSLWFRYTSSMVKGTFLTLLNAKKPNPTKILEVNEAAVHLHVGLSVEKISFQKEANKYWHHLFIFMSGKTSKVLVALDGKTIGNFTNARLTNQTFFQPNGLIVLGKYVNKTGALIDDGFVGEVSQFAIWEEDYTGEERLSLAKNCTVNLNDSIIPWVGLLNGAGQNVSLLEKWSCGKNTCPAEFTGRFCETEIDKIPPVVVRCPPSKKVITANATTRVTWEEPKFSDDKGVVEVIRSHTPGQIFGWGDYIITYIAKDAFDNSAVCTFELFVTPYNCSELKSSPNSIDACGTWKWGRFCDFQCMANFSLAVLKPPFYSCGRMGHWSHGPPTYPENPQNLLPACSATQDPVNTGSNQFVYQSTKCDDQFKEKFIAKFKKLIESVHETWQICGDECNFDFIRMRCNKAARVRRDVAYAYTHTLEVSFDTQFTNLLSKEQKVELQRGIKNGTIDMTLNIDGQGVPLQKSEARVAETEKKCLNGSVLKKDKCVLCPVGTFKSNNTNMCDPCPIGSYATKSGSMKCQSCPTNQSTVGVGSTSSNQCVEECPAGHYFDNVKPNCKACPMGFYKENTGFGECNTCPLGRTTKITGAATADACTVTCPLGTEMLNSKCSPCMHGYYRNNVNQPECVACPYGKTTYERGRTDSVCELQCEAGYELSSNGSQCIPCDSGHYRQSLKSRTCTKCLDNQVTKGYGSARKDACFKPASSTLYDASMTFTSLTWNENLQDEGNPEFRKLAYRITNAILSVYRNEKRLNSIKINRMSPGSVVSSLTFSFVNNFNDPFQQLRDEISKDNLDGLAVNASAFATDRCIHFTCPVDQFCWYNATGAGCSCNEGFYMSNDGQKCFANCEVGYCLNDGVCRATESGRSCTCPSEYKGVRCEDEDGGPNVALIIGLIVAALVLILIIFLCCRRRKRSSQHSILKNSEHFSSDNVKSTPIVVRIEPKKSSVKDSPSSFKNKAAELSDEGGESKVDHESNKVTVYLSNNNKSNDLEMDVVTSPGADKSVTSDQNNAHMSFI